MHASADRQWPHSALYEGDAPLWISYAQALRAGQRFELDLPVHPPGLAYALAWLWPGGLSGAGREATSTGQAGGGFVTLKVVWCILGAAACGAIYVATRRTFLPRAALLAAAMSAVSFALIVQSTSLNNETPYLLLLIALAAMANRLAERPGAAVLTVWAALNAVAALIRVEHSLLLALWVIWLAWRWKRQNGEEAKRQDVETSKTRSVEEASRAAGQPNGETGDQPPARYATVAGRLAIIAIVYFIVPLPWNLRAYRAIERFNTAEPAPIDYTASPVAWRPEARAYLQSLPAFVREPCFRVITSRAILAGRAEVDEADARRFFIDDMGFEPRPISPYVFISAQGPLAFAMANRPGGDGGFSTEPLGPKGTLNFADPRQLRLFVDGYRAGWQTLSKPGEARRLISSKMSFFLEGWTQGVGLANWPAGLTGTRRAVDQFTAGPVASAHDAASARDAPSTDTAPSGTLAALQNFWRASLLGLGICGLVICLMRRRGGPWLLIVLYKLLVTAAFFGYARQAASILPVFYLFVAVAADAIVLGPIAGYLSQRARQGSLAAAGVAIVVMLTVQATSRIEYDVTGDADPAPQWGPGAFESHQPMHVQILRH